MNQQILNNIEQLHLIFRCFRSHNGLGYWFRGQANSDWSLIPKAGRKEYYLPNNSDLARFREWEDQAIAYEILPNSGIEKLAIAQHHGLATRLLDWTQNPLVASYFAVSAHENSDGVIYILEALEFFVEPNISLKDIEKNKGVTCYMPRAISPRVINQRGMFTLHCPANKEIEIIQSRFDPKEFNLRKVIIPSQLKTEVVMMLNDYGINESTLFPDLDGLSRFKNWDATEMVKRKST